MKDIIIVISSIEECEGILNLFKESNGFENTHSWAPELNWIHCYVEDTIPTRDSIEYQLRNWINPGKVEVVTATTILANPSMIPNWRKKVAVQELTVAEISKRLGYEVKVVK
jgi:hypothetical protein